MAMFLTLLPITITVILFPHSFPLLWNTLSGNIVKRVQTEEYSERFSLSLPCPGVGSGP